MIALSSAGALDVSSSSERDTFSLEGLERGGAPPSTWAGAHGVGSKLVERSARRQLGGSSVYDLSEANGSPPSP